MTGIELEVPERFSKHGITRIFLGDSYVKTNYKDTTITTDFDIKRLKAFTKEFREVAGKVITSNGSNATDVIEELLRHILNESTQAYENGRVKQTTTTTNTTTTPNSNGTNEQQQPRRAVVMKYTVETDSGNGKSPLPQKQQLWETVKIKGKHYLVSFNAHENKLYTVEDLSEPNRTLVPYSEEGIEHYTFQSANELIEYIELAKIETVGTLFKKVKEWASKFYDTDTQEYIDLIAADVVGSYFVDKLGKTHYIFVWGEPDQGKGAILETFNQLGYRAVNVSDATAPTIYRILGSVEKGQAVLIIDEANELEDNTFLLNILKVGYKGNTKIPRVMDAQSSENSKIEYFYPYGFKIIAAEHLPTQWKTGGFLSRCLKIKSAPGDPEIDIGDVVDNAGDIKNARVMHELSEFRKLLFAYRLLYYHEPIPDIKIKGITGRDRELIKPLLRLFKTHGDTESLEIIKRTMYFFVKERNIDKSDDLKAAVFREIKNLFILNPDVEDSGELAYSDIWECLKDKFNGKDIPDKTGTMSTDLYGEVNAKKLAAIFRSLGGKNAKDGSGNRRVWKFKLKTLERFGRVYKDIPETIEVEEVNDSE